MFRWRKNRHINVYTHISIYDHAPQSCLPLFPFYLRHSTTWGRHACKHVWVLVSVKGSVHYTHRVRSLRVSSTLPNTNDESDKIQSQFDIRTSSREQPLYTYIYRRGVRLPAIIMRPLSASNSNSHILYPVTWRLYRRITHQFGHWQPTAKSKGSHEIAYDQSLHPKRGWGFDLQHSIACAFIL